MGHHHPGAAVSAPRVEHDAAASRFVARLAGGEGFLSYVARGDGMLDLQHTVVPESERGRGVGEALVRAAVEHARREGSRVVPTCPFVAAWLDDHPEARALVAG